MGKTLSGSESVAELRLRRVALMRRQQKLGGVTAATTTTAMHSGSNRAKRGDENSGDSNAAAAAGAGLAAVSSNRPFSPTIEYAAVTPRYVCAQPRVQLLVFLGFACLYGVWKHLSMCIC